MLKGSGSRQVCLKTRRTVERHCRWTRLTGESQKKLLENWKKMRRFQMKRRIHQRWNLRERRMEERPGLQKWKTYSDLHYMMVWVVHRKVLEVHTKVLEVCRMASDACKIALVLEA